MLYLLKTKGSSDQYGELESLKNCSKERSSNFRCYRENSTLKRPVNKLYLRERIKDTVTEVANEVMNITDGRSRRKAATLGEIQWKFNI